MWRAVLAFLFVVAAILAWLIWETSMALTFDDDFDDEDEDVVEDDARFRIPTDLVVSVKRK